MGVSLAAPKAARPVPKPSIFKQNTELLQQVEGLRYRLRNELAEKQRQIDAMAARIAALTDEIATLRRAPAGKASHPQTIDATEPGRMTSDFLVPLEACYRRPFVPKRRSATRVGGTIPRLALT